MLDLTVDRKKTFGWATTVPLRTALRERGIRVLHHARELGGHMGVSRQWTNRTLKQRIDGLEDFWHKLRACKASYRSRVAMLRAVAWPRGLHAVASAPIGDQVWLTLRRLATKSVGFQRPGVNPVVLLGLVEVGADPQFVVCLWTLRFLRSHCPVDFWSTCVAPLAFGDIELPPNSLAAIALHRVISFGLGVTCQGHVRDRFGSFCLSTDNPAEHELRLQWSWQQFVACQVSHRHDFQGLETVDVAATCRALSVLSAHDQALYRVGLSGGLYRESYKAKWADQSDQCLWCGAHDTLRHRFWECPHHHDLRLALAPDALRDLSSLPPVLALRGWAVLPPTWPAWIRRLLDLPPVSYRPWISLPLAGCDLFTDGSCLCQSDPLLRCAAWSVTLAVPFSDGWTPGALSIVGSDCLPGICQTAYRAELFAVGVALHYAAIQGVPARIWTNYLGVINRFHQLTSGGCKLNRNRSNADLWAWVLAVVERLGLDRVRIYKVPAHRSYVQASTARDAWMAYYNEFADRVAKTSNMQRPHGFWDFWEQHAQEVVSASIVYKQVFDLHLAVGRRQVQSSVRLPDPAGVYLSVPHASLCPVFVVPDGMVAFRRTQLACTAVS